MRRVSQRERIIQLLTDNRTVCGTTFHRLYMPTARNRISELNRQPGWWIRTEPCDDVHHHHKTPQVQYRLIYRPTGVS